MGTLAEGTRCYYCDAELAGYVPDGGGPIGSTCQRVLLHRGAQDVVRIRLRRRAAGWRCVAPVPSDSGPATAHGLGCAGFQRVMAIDTVAEQVALFCIWV